MSLEGLCNAKPACSCEELLLTLRAELRPAKRPKREKRKKDKKPKERVLVSGSGNLEEAEHIRGIFGARCMVHSFNSMPGMLTDSVLDSESV